MVKGLIRMLGLVAKYPGRFAWYVLASLLLAILGGAHVFIIREVTAILASQTLPAWFDPYVNGALTVFNPEWTVRPSMRHAYFALLFLTCGLALLKCGSMYMRRYLEAWLTRSVIMDMQQKLAGHLLSLDLGYFHHERSGDLLSRFSSDLMFLGRSVKFATVLLTQPMQIACYLGAIFYIKWELALLGLIGAPLGGIVINTLSRKMRKASKKAQEKRADLTSAMVQFLTGMHIIKAFACEEFEKKQFASENRYLFEVTMKRERARARVRPIVEFVSMFGTLIALAVGGEWVFNGTLEFKDMTAFLAALMMMYGPAKDMSRANNDLQEALPGADRVFHVLDKNPTIVEGTYTLNRFEDAIRFENVSFQYLPGKPVLHGIGLELKKGTCIALVGPSGAGKSTIADMVPRFYDPNGGRISIDKKDLRQVTFTSLRDKIAVVSQEPFLFNSSIRDNIAYGRADATLEMVEAAAKAANIHDEIIAMTDGYDTNVGDRGGNLSGGQRQRIAIARALFKDAPILILDEATSSLDSESERKVQDALERLMKGRTSLVIAHRLSTVQHADTIHVLEDGRITASGRHEELLTTSPTYAHLVQLQNTQEGSAS